MQEPLHLQEAANLDESKTSRQKFLSQESSLTATTTSETDSGGTESESTEDQADAEDRDFEQSSDLQSLSESGFVSEDKLSNIPLFKRSEIFEGIILGKGGFGIISEIKGFSLLNAKDSFNLSSSSFDFDFKESKKCEEKDSRQFIADHCFLGNGNARYAIKRLNRNTLQDKLNCQRGLSDLANEALFLGSIDHPHIIKIRGMSTDAVSSKGFFIIMDRLYDTLASRLSKWKAKKKKLSGIQGQIQKKVSMQRKLLFLDRLDHAAQLSSALAYLHSHKIIHRDLKPENIGFDQKSDIKLFDFGLARELPREHPRSSDYTFHMTMNAGTPRYMAPEVSSGRYNLSCDIYSMGLILWEFISLRRPFKEQKSLEDFQRNVWSPKGSQCRPSIPRKLSPGLRRLLTRSWGHDLNERPTAEEFEITLRREIVKLERDSNGGDLDSSSHSLSGSGKGKVTLLDTFGASMRSLLGDSSHRSEASTIKMPRGSSNPFLLSDF